MIVLVTWIVVCAFRTLVLVWTIVVMAIDVVGTVVVVEMMLLIILVSVTKAVIEVVEPAAAAAVPLVAITSRLANLAIAV